MAPLIVIGGTTASGKSALALKLASRMDGVILNADSVQLHADLSILTARPGPDDLKRAEHRLYGLLGPFDQSSVALWLDLVAPELEALRVAGRPAILVGGTGLYIKALLRGIQAMPDIPHELRARLRGLDEPSPALHERLREVDPKMAARLEPGDRQRILRALEVKLASGRSLLDWQADEPVRPPLPGPVAGIALLPERTALRQRIAERLDRMLEAGLLDQLAAFLKATEGRESPLFKADGAAEFAAHLAGEISLEEARRRTLVKIGRYAKRQATFFRHQLPELAPLAAWGDDPAALDLVLGQAALAGGGEKTAGPGGAC